MDADLPTAELDAIFRSNPIHALLGIEVVEWAPGSASVRMRARDDQANVHGGVHGGVLFSLADAAFEIASNSYGRVCVGLDTTCHYAAPAEPGDELTAIATEMSRSRRAASYRVEVQGADGRLRAWSLATAHRTERWHLGAERWPEAWRDDH